MSDHGGVMEAEALVDLCRRLPRLKIAISSCSCARQSRLVRGDGVVGGSAVDRDVDAGHRVSDERRCSLVLSLLDVPADGAQCDAVLLGDLDVGQAVLETVSHHLLHTLPSEPNQEAALPEVRLRLGRPAASERSLHARWAATSV
jgi:hypothetical protein